MRVLRLLLSSSSRFIRVTFLWVLLLPYGISFLGASSNQLVLIANHDKFPVLVNPKKAGPVDTGGYWPDDNMHVVMSSETHLNFLADIFDFHSETDSIGDLLLSAGGWLQTFCPFVYIALVTIKLSGNNDQPR